MWIFVWWDLRFFALSEGHASVALRLCFCVTVSLQACAENVGFSLKSDSYFTSVYRKCRNHAKKRQFLYRRVQKMSKSRPKATVPLQQRKETIGTISGKCSKNPLKQLQKPGISRQMFHKTTEARARFDLACVESTLCFQLEQARRSELLSRAKSQRSSRSSRMRGEKSPKTRATPNKSCQSNYKIKAPIL